MPSSLRDSKSTRDFVNGVGLRNAERAASDGQLPLWPESVRGVPNGVLRSALFGATRRGKRRYMELEAVASLDGVSIVYTGPRLDQSDLDVWEGALHLARATKLGNRVEFSSKGFLRLIGRGGVRGDSIGKSDKVWLGKVLARLTTATIVITHGPYEYHGHLIDEYFRDSDRGRYVVILNSKLKAIFNRDTWSQIDWGIRYALQGHPLAQWLHGFYSTHAAPFPYKIETLHRLCGSERVANAHTETGRNRALLGWKEDTLIPALRLLELACCGAGQPFSWKFLSDGKVEINRTPSTSQQRHIRGRKKPPGLPNGRVDRT